MTLFGKPQRKERFHERRLTMPFAHTSRRKPRRWPLALRFIKGSIHGVILIPVILHALWTVLIVFLNRKSDGDLGLPPSIIPSLSIVVGLMLVFRNQTSYNRFWEGRNHLTVVITCVRNLTRTILTCSYTPPSPNTPSPSQQTHTSDRASTERVVKILAAILFATKNHLRASSWGACTLVPGAPLTPHGYTTGETEYGDLLPHGLVGLDHRGVGIPLQLTFFVEQYIKKGVEKGWFHPPQASQMSAQVSALVDAYGRMETIRLTPIPVAHLIHQKQVLALFGMVLPFAMVSTLDWWAVPIVTLVIFTLYGIDGIASQLEDPFGRDKIDINLDDIVEDIRMEILVLVDEWKRVDDVAEETGGEVGGEADGQGDRAEWFMGRGVGMMGVGTTGRRRTIPEIKFFGIED